MGACASQKRVGPSLFLQAEIGLLGKLCASTPPSTPQPTAAPIPTLHVYTPRPRNLPSRVHVHYWRSTGGSTPTRYCSHPTDHPLHTCRLGQPSQSRPPPAHLPSSPGQGSDQCARRAPPPSPTLAAGLGSLIQDALSFSSGAPLKDGKIDAHRRAGAGKVQAAAPGRPKTGESKPKPGPATSCNRLGRAWSAQAPGVCFDF